VYQVRRVLNDWPDEACVTILRHLHDACAPDSHVLVAENLVSEQASEFVGHCAIDLFMMNFGGKRRTQKGYARLAEEAGFRVCSIITKTIGLLPNYVLRARFFPTHI
jgi:hypothetical protein